jgi:tyrosyl-DNA phosphodiesterase 2
MVSNSMLPSLLRKQMGYAPQHQPFYTFLNGAWRAPVHLPAPKPAAEALQSFHLITWNIDFMAPQPKARMASALSYLEGLVSSIPMSSAVVIFLQEMSEVLIPLSHVPNDFTQLCQAPWIRRRFHMTDIDLSTTNSTYGQVTLVDRRLSVASVSRLPFVSEFERDAILVNIRLASDNNKMLRLCNVHLDSMHGNLRPIQWKALAKHLQSHEDAAASIVAGDCNANQPRDQTEPQNNGFKDAYLELGGTEGDEDGMTWGFQSLNWKRFGRSRMDKIVFWGEVEVKSLERIGVGLEVEDEDAREQLTDEGELPFVTDHYGLMGHFNIDNHLATIDYEEEAGHGGQEGEYLFPPIT